MCIPGLDDLIRTNEAFDARGVELMVILPLPLAQCHEIVESLGLNYPLYSDPEWQVFEAYGTGHILYAPKQSWVGINPDGTVRYVWRQGADQAIQPVPLPLEALDAFRSAPAQ